MKKSRRQLIKELNIANTAIENLHNKNRNQADIILRQEAEVRAATRLIEKQNKELMGWKHATEGWMKAAHGIAQALEGVHMAQLEKLT